MRTLKNVKTNVVRDTKNYTYQVKGEFVPSVNEIIKRIYPFNGLPGNSIMTQATDRGDYIHAMLNDYFTGEEQSKTLIKKLEKFYDGRTIDTWHEASLNAIDAIDAKFPIMDEFIAEIPLCHSRKKFAGTFDLLFRVGNEIIIIDFKTSRDYRHVRSNKNDKKAKSEMQLAAYNSILKNMFKVEVDKHYVLSIGFNGVDFVEIKPNHSLFETALQRD